MAAATAAEVLEALDEAKLRRYHLNVFLAAGIGTVSASYGLFSIGTVSRLLGRIYYFEPSSARPGFLPPNVAAALTASALCGTLVGQLLFGWLGDRMGRKRAYGAALVALAAALAASAMSFGGTATAVLATLCFFRFWVGLGAGGSMLLAAALMAEYASRRRRGTLLAAVLAMQGPGILASVLVSMAVAAAFNGSSSPAYAADRRGSTPGRADFAWRIVLAFGAAPALVALARLSAIPESPRFTALVAGDARRAGLDMAMAARVVSVDRRDQPQPDAVSVEKPPDIASVGGPRSPARYGLFSREFGRRHGLHLLGAAAPWFLLSAGLYSQTLLQRNIFSAMGWLPPPAAMSALEEVYKLSRAQLLLALCSTIPGIWLTIALVDVLGRVKLQLLGFLAMSAFLFGLAAPYDSLKATRASLVLYAFAFFFANFGPNLTTAIVAAELFPARLRTTCFGVSAAAGKAGAIAGTFGFLYASQSAVPGQQDPGYPNGIGLRSSLLILAAVNALGFFFTFLVPETKHRSLEEISGEIGDLDVNPRDAVASARP